MGDIVLISKRDEWCLHAGQLAQMVFGEQVYWVKGRAGEKIPDILTESEPRVLISFLSPWIVPRNILEKCEISINFHPGSTNYPGIGCYNFALYEGAERFGATCHFMNEKVDTGDIIEERTFPILNNESVETLKYKTMIAMISMYMDVLHKIVGGENLEPSGKKWLRKPFTRKQLNDLCVIALDMGSEEIRRRVRATNYPGYPGASISLGGVTFSSPVPDRKPLA